MADKTLMDDFLFGDLLVTPGYDVDYSVGMTYSLDLETMLAVPMAFGAFGELDDTAKKSPLFLLEAIRRSSKKFLIFCNRGEIRARHDCQKIFSLLEDSVCEVYSKTQTGSDGRYNSQLSNFHPKIWIIKETNRDDKTDKKMRVVILSRNLTFDNSLDVAVSLTGDIVEDREVDSSKQRPLIAMLTDLKGFTNVKQWEKVMEVINGLNHVERFEIGDMFSDYDFIVYNPDGTVHTSITENRYKIMQGTKDLFIFSPFIDIDTLEWMNYHKVAGSNRFLVTRRESITQRIIDFYKSNEWKIYVVKDSMLDNEIMPVDLHAKMYFLSAPHYDSGAYMFTGSANATRTAFGLPTKPYKGHLNTEILIRLKFSSPTMFGERIKDEFLNDKDDCKFELLHDGFVPFSDSEVKYSEAEKLLKDIICDEQLKASCIKTDDNLYSVVISSNEDRLSHFISCRVDISPLQCPKYILPLTSKTLFERIRANCLSEFYIVSVVNENDIEDKIERVIKIPTVGIPSDRNDSILNSYLDSEDKFYKYFSLMITDRPGLTLGDLVMSGESHERNTHEDRGTVESQFYEQLLRIAAKEPNRLEEIDKLIRRLDKRIIPSDFEDMYNGFRNMIPFLKML